MPAAVDGRPAPPRANPSLRQRLGAMRNLPPFLVEIWRTSRGLTLATIVLRLVRAFLPIAMLYVGKLIIDEAVRLVGLDVAADPARPGAPACWTRWPGSQRHSPAIDGPGRTLRRIVRTVGRRLPMKGPSMPRTTALALCLAAPLALAACAQSPRPGDTPASGAATPATSATAPTPAGQLRVDTVATGLEHPWSVALLPDGGFLVTERPGRLRRISASGTLSAPIAGVPQVWARGQGGLLDVALDPGFAGNRRIWLSYAEPGENGTAGTAVATATLATDALSDLRVVYRQVPKLDGGQHFGSRIVFDGQGHVFISHGDRGQKSMAQDLDVLQGKLVRLNLDGSQPADNPFAAGPGVRKAIWSYGHRNIQGMARDPRTGKLWLSEHGPRGGDEINLPQASKNYGWPVVSHGNDYVTNRPYPETRGTEAPGMEPPHHVWPKSPGLSGMAFLTGRPGHPWNDSLFLGALAERNLIRLRLDGDRIASEERLLDDLGQRIRDVRVGPRGEVYVLTDESGGRLLRLTAPSAG